jgi:hypothetical protein
LLYGLQGICTTMPADDKWRDQWFHAVSRVITSGSCVYMNVRHHVVASVPVSCGSYAIVRVLICVRKDVSDCLVTSYPSIKSLEFAPLNKACCGEYVSISHSGW